MIKKNKKNKYVKTKQQILMEYLRTIGFSFSFALVFTVVLAIHARSEMIRNLYVNPEEQFKIDEAVARQIIVQSDLLKDLKNKKYAICMQVGNLYETIQDYKNAQFAYELALERANCGNYAPYYKLVVVLTAQEKFKDAEKLINSLEDIQNTKLIKFKTRAYIVMGDKYYSIGKFLSAAKSYEKAKYYYDKFAKKDKVVDKSILERVVNAYVETADVLVKRGQNSDAVRFLEMAEKYSPDDFKIKYKLAIIYSDLDPQKSVKYFEPLLEKEPQNIDYGVFNKALMKSANIADLEGNNIQAKYYRYKIHSVDIFVNQKVVYKNDIEVLLDSFKVRKIFFKYKLKSKFKLKNVSNNDIRILRADFILKQDNRVLETVSKTFADKSKPLYSNGGESPEVEVIFGKNIFTRSELERYSIDIYLYKDEKFKTLITTMPVSQLYSSK